MTLITTDCPDCGRVELGVDDVTVVVNPREGTAWYLFDCAGCAQQVVKAASDAVVAALLRVHVTVRMLPVEVLERGPVAVEAPGLGVDDLLDLMLCLRSRDELAGLLVEAVPVSAARRSSGYPGSQAAA